MVWKLLERFRGRQSRPRPTIDVEFTTPVKFAVALGSNPTDGRCLAPASCWVRILVPVDFRRGARRSKERKLVAV